MNNMTEISQRRCVFIPKILSGPIQTGSKNYYVVRFTPETYNQFLRKLTVPLTDVHFGHMRINLLAKTSKTASN